MAKMAKWLIENGIQAFCCFFFILNGGSLFSIKFCIRKWNLFFSKNGRGTEKSNQTQIFFWNVVWHQWQQNWKVGGPKFLRIQLTAIGGSGIGCVRLWFWSCNLWPHPFFAQKCTKSAKSNPIFHLKGRKDKALVLTYLDPPMAEAFLW